MGINLEVLEILHETVDWDGLSVLEFGDQMICDPRGHYTAKEWFLSKGVHKHISLDLNGARGALDRDVRGDLSDLGMFDVVTNFGTLEHLDDGTEGQIAGFANTHSRCVVGGLVIHDIPLVENYRGHSPVLYSHDFLLALYSENDYELVRGIQITNGCHTGVFLKKSNRTFRFSEKVKRELRLFPGEGYSGAWVCN